VSAENVQLVRDLYATFLERGRTYPENYTDDFVWDMSTFAGWPEKQQYPAYEGMQEFLREWMSAFDDWAMEIRDVIDAGGDWVVAICHQTGRSKSTGAAVDMTFAQVWTIRGDQIAYQRMYADVGQALESVGAERRKAPRSET
jgi:ketosteroid isomerase-like protein